MLFPNIHSKLSIIGERERERERERKRSKEEKGLCYMFAFFAVILIMNICVIRFKRFVSNEKKHSQEKFVLWIRRCF